MDRSTGIQVDTDGNVYVTGRGGGLIVNIIVGIVGAFIGGFIMSLFGGTGVTGFNLSSFLVAILGAVVLLVVLGLIKR